MPWYPHVRITVRNILTPGILLTAIVTPMCFWLASLPGRLQIAYFTVGCLPFAVVLGAFLVFLFKDPSKLLTEETQVQHLLTATFGQSAQTGREAAAIIEAIRRDPQLQKDMENPYITYYDHRDNNK